MLWPLRGALMSTADRISRGFHRLGLIYAAIPVLAGIYDAYESARHFEQQRTIDWLTIVINELLPRLGLSLLLAFFVYNLFRAGDHAPCPSCLTVVPVEGCLNR